MHDQEIVVVFANDLVLGPGEDVPAAVQIVEQLLGQG